MTKLPVFLRLKPEAESSSNGKSFLRVTTSASAPPMAKAIVDPPKDSRYKAEESFDFNGIFNEKSSQTDVYTQAVYPLVKHVIDGSGDALFFAMGSSGSGKTHTILGYKNTPGMVQLAVDTLFKAFRGRMANFETIEALSDRCNPDRTSSAVEAGLVIDWATCDRVTKPPAVGINSSPAKKQPPRRQAHASSRPNITPETSNKFLYSVYISMVEIYNDRVFDLLQETTNGSSAAHRKPLPIKTNTSNGKTYLSNVRKVFATNEKEALKTIDLGLSRRAMHSTGVNSTSSRSHAFISLEVKRISKVPAKQDRIDSYSLSIVDLAGSERVKVSQTNGNQLVESCAINKSLMLLGQCLQKQRDLELSSKHVAAKPTSAIFRNSRLTQLLLSNVFNEELNQKSVLLVNVDPYGDFSSTSQILRYSALARQVSVPNTRIMSLSRIASTNSGSNEGNSRSVSSSSSVSNNRSVSGSSSATSVSTGLGAIKEAGPDQLCYEGSDKPVSLLQARIQDLTIQLEAANDRCYEIEEATRQEMADAMEKVAQDLHRQYRLMMADENDRGQRFTDSKLQLFAENIVQPSNQQRLLEELELLRSQNRSLQQENHRLESMLMNSSI